MPCYTPEPTTDEINRSGNVTHAQAQAILCGVLTVLEEMDLMNEVTNEIDWSEVGVSRALAATWWEKHKEADNHRRTLKLKKLQRKYSQTPTQKARRD